MAEPRIPQGFDFTDPEIYVQRVPADELAELRRIAPVWWNAQPRGSAGFDDDGYWVVTRHADVVEISRSWENRATIRHSQPIEESSDLQGLVLLNIAPPEHTKLRGIISRGFTPRAIGSLHQALAERAQRIVAAALQTGTGDF